MRSVVVAGIGTGVGKTLVSAILVQALQADYWKPIQCGGSPTDREIVEAGTAVEGNTLHAEAYSFSDPVSALQAAKRAGVCLEVAHLSPPATPRVLVIEQAGGVLSPVTEVLSNLELMRPWEAVWIVVSRHYLGSINHTLLTLDVLHRAGCDVAGIVFNGPSLAGVERAIHQRRAFRFVGRLLPQRSVSKQVILNLAEQWKHPLKALF